MILSVSRRTDIPAFYSDWFFNRMKDGFVLVRNPMNYRQISKIQLTKDVIDFIVFWTRNPAQIINRLDELGDIPFYFLVTLTGYGSDIEENLPDKEYLIKQFQRLSNKIGKERIIWRYDPILMSKKHLLEFHVKNFEYIADRLNNFTEKCIFSFVDIIKYKKCIRNLKATDIREINKDEKIILVDELLRVANKNNIELQSCAENICSDEITKSSCIDKNLIELISGNKLKFRKDKNQRENCACTESIDIGSYDSCIHGCKYCYANYNQERARMNYILHLVDSPMQYGEMSNDDIINERIMKSLKIE